MSLHYVPQQQQQQNNKNNTKGFTSYVVALRTCTICFGPTALLPHSTACMRVPRGKFEISESLLYAVDLKRNAK
jgi:hypothetical protein